jgi:beta-glucanase (GH16 family)
MRFSFPLAVAGLAFSLSPLLCFGAERSGPDLDLRGYHLSFDWEADRFHSSPFPGPGRWTTTLSDGLRHLSNGDQQCWTDDTTGHNPFTIGDGVLDIIAKPTSPTPCGGALSYVSGVFTSQGYYAQKHGYFELSAKLPRGVGMWPAFWLLTVDSNRPHGWPPELDVLEAFGAPNTNGEGGQNQVHWAVHSHDRSAEGGGWVSVPADIYAGFHAYGALWTAKTISFYFDRHKIAQIPTPKDYVLPMYVITGLAVGGGWPGNADGEMAHMGVKYIRIFSDDPAIPAIPTPPTGER